MSEALIISGSKTDTSAVERIPVFAIPVEKPNPAYIEGDAVPEGYDESTPETITEIVTYDMPAEMNVAIALEYGEISARNAYAAQVFLIKEAVGQEGYDALVSELKKMSKSDARASLEAVAGKIVPIALGN